MLVSSFKIMFSFIKIVKNLYNWIIKAKYCYIITSGDTGVRLYYGQNVCLSQSINKQYILSK